MISSLANSSMLNFCKRRSVSDCVGVSLTMKQNDQGVSLDEVRASENLKHFLNFLNRTVFRKQYSRFRKKLAVLPVLERSSSGRWHFHLTLEKPQTFACAPDRPVLSEIERNVAFEKLIKQCWKKTKFGYSQVHVDHAVTGRWLDYSLKDSDVGDGVDWRHINWN
jgi:hypothetical protein